jgi:gamma-glutamylcyclotransferase (GGCT)/AIG2-like uncharacterized protein YtfP
MAEATRVFVYGTLRRGGSNAHRMAGAKFLGSGAVRGRLYRVSWYPGVVLDAAGDGSVRGDLWEIPAEILPALDAFEGVPPGETEGAEYRRVRVIVEASASEGPAREAWMWEWIGGVEGLEEMPGGDWLDAGGP